ncbi:MAG: hypothetical protein L0Y44_14285 [Phycisphaerales bacterium]|nr:hypothetical protein [Phycisphaerales bacterium]MCI0631811.1 hypothetical protein [Phycisphaerales bacterium]
MQSIRALLNRIIDYAGLFPPAKLDMQSTVRNYSRYLKSDDAWILGRLIIPVARFAEFELCAAELFPQENDEADDWRISALTAAAGAPEFHDDLQAIESFNLRHEDAGGRAQVDVIEVKADSAPAIDSVLNQLPPDLFAFFEVPIDRDPRGLIAALADGQAGAKVRTGGLTPDAFPSPENLARFIEACASANVPFKATAGLHHPLPHSSDSLNVREFGFLNVFLAGCFAQTHELKASELIQLLDEDSSTAFAFSNGGVAWRNHRIEAANIEDVREEFAISFGSCSFDEPLADLRALNLLE